MHSEINDQLIRLACPSSDDFKAILSKGADFNQINPDLNETPFADILYSICAGDLLVECINAGASTNPISTKSGSPLIQAAMAHDYRSMAILLEQGADLNIACFTDDDPQTPLDIVYSEFHCLRRPADKKICEAMEMILREFGGKTFGELSNRPE